MIIEIFLIRVYLITLCKEIRIRLSNSLAVIKKKLKKNQKKSAPYQVESNLNKFIVNSSSIHHNDRTTAPHIFYWLLDLLHEVV